MRYVCFGFGIIIGGALLTGVVSAQSEAPRVAVAVVRDTADAQLGAVTFTQQGGRMTVHAVLSALPEGFHGFHIHAVGECAGNFTSAGGHLSPAGSPHPAHMGDMPSLLMNPDGTAELRFVSDRLTMADLLDADGSAVMVHADPDNYGNIPTRYAPEPDATTLGTGYAGARIA